MSRILYARGIANEVHMDNSDRSNENEEMRKRKLLQRVVRPSFSRHFDTFLFLDFFPFCAEDLLYFLSLSLKYPVLLSTNSPNNTSSVSLSFLSIKIEIRKKINQFFFLSQVRELGASGCKWEDIVVVDGKYMHSQFNFVSGFCENIIGNSKVYTSQFPFLLSSTSYYVS